MDEKDVIAASKLSNIHDFVRSLPKVKRKELLNSTLFRATKPLLGLVACNYLEGRNKDWQSLERSSESQKFYC